MTPVSPTFLSLTAAPQSDVRHSTLIDAAVVYEANGCPNISGRTRLSVAADTLGYRDTPDPMASIAKMLGVTAPVRSPALFVAHGFREVSAALSRTRYQYVNYRRVEIDPSGIHHHDITQSCVNVVHVTRHSDGNCMVLSMIGHEPSLTDLPYTEENVRRLMRREAPYDLTVTPRGLPPLCAVTLGQDQDEVARYTDSSTALDDFAYAVYSPTDDLERHMDLTRLPHPVQLMTILAFAGRSKPIGVVNTSLDQIAAALPGVPLVRGNLKERESSKSHPAIFNPHAMTLIRHERELARTIFIPRDLDGVLAAHDPDGVLWRSVVDALHGDTETVAAGVPA